MVVNDMAWLARQVADTCALPRHGMTGLLKALRNNKALETTWFDEFEALYGFLYASKRIFTDDLNVSNLKRYLWDYMTSDSVIRNRCFQFFFNNQTAQVHQTTSHPTVAFSLLVDSPRLIQQGRLHPDGCRLLIYSLVLECATTSAQWAHRKRQRANMVDHVVEYINAMEPVYGVSLRAFSKFVSMAVVDGTPEILTYEDFRKKTAKDAPKRLRDAPKSLQDDTATLDTILFDEDLCAPKTRQSKKSRRTQKKRAAAERLQACVRDHLRVRRAKHTAASLIARTIRGIIRERVRREAAMKIQRRARMCISTRSWVADRRLALRLAALESRSQATISDQICDAREIEPVVERLALDEEFDVCFDDTILRLCKSVAQDALSEAHNQILHVQRALSSIAGVQVHFQGQVYQMHVARSSDLYKRRNDTDLARQILSSSQAKLIRLFAPNFEGGALRGDLDRVG